MSKRLGTWVVMVAVAAAGVGCHTGGDPDDAIKAIEKSQMNRGVPSPTELPPGLGQDLPTPPSTQPQLNP
jgi:hypothetical protein